LTYSGNGTRFASGGADSIVIIWKSSGQGLLKYNHSAPIQIISFNPTSIMLTSCTEVDFGIWTPDQKQVTKEKVGSRILSVSWSSDGNFLALGLLNGVVSIRNQKAEELLKIERKAPVWSWHLFPKHPLHHEINSPKIKHLLRQLLTMQKVWRSAVGKRFILCINLLPKEEYCSPSASVLSIVY
jgi:intraflagellar transport protein 122